MEYSESDVHIPLDEYKSLLLEVKKLSSYMEQLIRAFNGSTEIRNRSTNELLGYDEDLPVSFKEKESYGVWFSKSIKNGILYVDEDTLQNFK